MRFSSAGIRFDAVPVGDIPDQFRDTPWIFFMRQMAKAAQLDDLGVRRARLYLVCIGRRHSLVLIARDKDKRRLQAMKRAAQFRQVPIGHHAERTGHMARIAEQPRILFKPIGIDL